MFLKCLFAIQVEYSHKLTEKRRRDRMNSSMSEIAQLLPSSSPSKQVRLLFVPICTGLWWRHDYFVAVT